MTAAADYQPASTLESAASVVRSKNAGPFQITIDVLFRRASVYQAFKRSDVLTHDRVATLYGVPLDDVLGVYFWDAAYAIKVTLRRSASAGSINDRDCYGAQQHAPLLGLAVPEPDGTVEPLPSQAAAATEARRA